MPLHIQQATITLLKQLAYTAFFAAIFAASDYVGNHDQFNASQLIVAMILPVSLAIINTLEAFYQAKGDLAVVAGIDQLKPRIQFLEQRLFSMQPAPVQAVGPAPLLADLQPTQTIKAVPPIAPKFSVPAMTGPMPPIQPLSSAPPAQPEPTFSLIDQEMEANIARLSSFPFQEQGQEKPA